jgi:hypothetical protein
MSTTLAVLTVVVSAISIVISALLLGKQISLVRKQAEATHKWDVDKTSQETLKDLTTGDFPNWRDKIESDIGCRIPNPEENYDVKIAHLGRVAKKDLDFTLGRLLNMLEVVCINIKNNVVDEDTVYDYLGFILIQYVRWSEPYIRAKSIGDPRFLGATRFYAKKWLLRFDRERNQMKENGQASI